MIGDALPIHADGETGCCPQVNPVEASTTIKIFAQFDRTIEVVSRFLIFDS